jgi:hypothetical protein
MQMTDKDMLVMDWYVKGVQSQTPCSLSPS